MPIKLGVAPIAWTNSDMPALGGDTPLDVCLRESREAGYSGTETGAKFPMDADALRPILAEHGLALVSGWFSGKLLEISVTEEKRRIEQQLATFAALSAPVLVYAETTGSVQSDRSAPLSQRPKLAARDFAEYGRKLTELAEHMQQRGVALTYHHHMGTVIETEDEIDRLMSNTGPALGLLVDTGHLHFAGGSGLAVLERHAPRVNHVHCKDVRPEVLARVAKEGMSFLTAVLEGVFTVPGDGCIDFHAFAQGLKEVGYSGWVVVEAEQDPRKANPFLYAKKGHAHLADAFRKAGLEVVG